MVIPYFYIGMFWVFLSEKELLHHNIY